MARGRGGRRQGTPGAVYPNRTDLQAGPRKPPVQPVRVAPSQTYGDATAQKAAQQAIPLPAPTPITAPTTAPAEHVMAGAPTGPGPGPEALTLPAGGPPPAVDPAAVLRMLVVQHPDIPELRIMADQARTADLVQPVSANPEPTTPTVGLIPQPPRPPQKPPPIGDRPTAPPDEYQSHYQIENRKTGAVIRTIPARGEDDPEALAQAKQVLRSHGGDKRSKLTYSPAKPGIQV